MAFVVFALKMCYNLTDDPVFPSVFLSFPLPALDQGAGEEQHQRQEDAHEPEEQERKHEHKHEQEAETELLNSGQQLLRGQRFLASLPPFSEWAVKRVRADAMRYGLVHRGLERDAASRSAAENDSADGLLSALLSVLPSSPEEARLLTADAQGPFLDFCNQVILCQLKDAPHGLCDSVQRHFWSIAGRYLPVSVRAEAEHEQWQQETDVLPPEHSGDGDGLDRKHGPTVDDAPPADEVRTKRKHSSASASLEQDSAQLGKADDEDTSRPPPVDMPALPCHRFVQYLRTAEPAHGHLHAWYFFALKQCARHVQLSTPRLHQLVEGLVKPLTQALDPSTKLSYEQGRQFHRIFGRSHISRARVDLAMLPTFASLIRTRSLSLSASHAHPKKIHGRSRIGISDCQSQSFAEESRCCQSKQRWR